ncbi:MAG: hypothetical protein ACRDIB_00065 [Ardenticatenaceae bacterium]
MKRIIALAVVLAIVMFFAQSLTHSGAYASDVVNVQIGRNARIVDEGRAAFVKIAVQCAPIGVVLEAFVYLTQDGNESPFAYFPVTCDNQPHLQLVRVTTYDDTPFHPGAADASAYVLLYNPITGQYYDGQDNRTIRLR